MKSRYTIGQAIEDCALALYCGTDHGPITIRCAINDLLDQMSKDGMTVYHGYSKSKAIKAVQKRIVQLRMRGIYAPMY